MSDVQITVDLPHPVETVWRALTERRLMSEWFFPTDLAPVVGGVYRVFPPPGLAGFTAPFDVDVVEVDAPNRLVLRLRGEQLHAGMRWQLTSLDAGCRLTVIQTGFLGLEGERRRTELHEAYEMLFQQRLPALLARLALDDTPPSPSPSPSVRVPFETAPLVSPKPDTQWRLRFLSILGAMILTVLIVSALATLLVRPPDAPAGALPSERPPGQAAQPGLTPTPDRSGSPSTRPPAGVATSTGTAGANALSASYRTAETYDGSYIGSITIRAGSGPVSGWTATIELPQGADVTSAWDQVSFRQTGRRVTFTPAPVHTTVAAGAEFTFSFQVGDLSNVGKPSACAVNDSPCTGL